MTCFFTFFIVWLTKFLISKHTCISFQIIVTKKEYSSTIVEANSDVRKFSLIAWGTKWWTSHLYALNREWIDVWRLKWIWLVYISRKYHVEDVPSGVVSQNRIEVSNCYGVNIKRGFTDGRDVKLWATVQEILEWHQWLSSDFGDKLGLLFGVTL